MDEQVWETGMGLQEYSPTMRQVQKVDFALDEFKYQLYPVSECPKVLFEIDEEKLLETGYRVCAVVFAQFPDRPELLFFHPDDERPSDEALYLLYQRTSWKRAGEALFASKTNRDSV